MNYIVLEILTILLTSKRLIARLVPSCLGRSQFQDTVPEKHSAAMSYFQAAMKNRAYHSR